jgi:hypothetical protein
MFILWTSLARSPLSILRANQSSRVFYSDGPVTQRDVELADQERLMSVRERLLSIFIVIALFEFDSFRQTVSTMRREPDKSGLGMSERDSDGSSCGQVSGWFHRLVIPDIIAQH